MHTKVSLEVSSLNSGKPVSTTEDNSEPNQQERLKKLVQNENYKFWLGGFIEGSLLVSIVKNNKLTHGLALLFSYFYNKLIYLPLFRACFYSALMIDLSCSSDKKSDQESENNNSKPKNQEFDLNNYKPIKSYWDAKENKKAIINDFKFFDRYRHISIKKAAVAKRTATLALAELGKSGVYCWTNKNSGRKYVGSAKEFSRRLREYYNIKTLMNKKSKIHSALLSLGHENFNFEILEICDSPLEQIKKEQEYINRIIPSAKLEHFKNCRFFRRAYT